MALTLGIYLELLFFLMAFDYFSKYFEKHRTVLSLILTFLEAFFLVMTIIEAVRILVVGK